MKTIKLLFVNLVAIFLLLGCAAGSIIKDKSSVINGKMALVKGIEIEPYIPLLSSLGLKKGIVIKEVNSNTDKKSKLELLLPEGKHTLNLKCSYKIEGGYYYSPKGVITVNVKSGNVYQLKSDFPEIQKCIVKIEDQGKFKL